MNRMRTSLAALLLLSVALAQRAAAADPIEDELARYADAAAKLQQSYDEGLGKERARALAALVAQAKREPSVSAGAVWKLVLALEPANDEARRWLGANGQLDEALTEVATQKGPLLADGRTTASTAAAVKPTEPRIDMTGAKLIKVPAARGVGAGIGNLRAGTIIIVQYVTGKWTSRRRTTTELDSPDDPATVAGNQVIIVDSQTEPATLANVPTGTADKPFVMTLSKDTLGVSLVIARQTGGLQAYEGEVQYRVRVIPPGAGNR
ncbi:MAG: hypothetical protein H0X38_13425 [Planctomycetes bacterium]|nr:hypothetical protein [Planctomycetota bacterium]